MLTQKTLHDLLCYDPSTGLFTWRVDRARLAKAGDIAGCIGNKGYREVSVAGHLCKAHRLAWFYVYGIWPRSMIDHIDGDRDNNRITNLREATNGQNKAAAGPQRNNALGVKGVSRDHYGYRAQIKSGGKKIYLGWFKTLEQASLAYQDAAKRLHGQFAFDPARER